MDIRKNRALTALGAATLFGTIGEGIFGLLAIVAVLHARGSALSVSSLLILMTLPSILLAPFQGVFLDRFDIRHLAVASNAMRAAIVLFLAAASWGRELTMNTLYPAITAYYVVWYFMVPLSETLVTRVTDKDGLHSGMVLLQGAWQVGALGSAFVAGVLLNLVPLSLVFILIASLDALSAACFATMKLEAIPARAAARERSGLGALIRTNVNSFRRDLAEGLAYIRSSKTILALVAVSAAVFPFYQAINTLLGPFNQNVLHGNALSLGMIEGMAGAGSFVSALLCARLTGLDESFRLLMFSESFLALSVAAFALSPSVAVAMALYFMIGLLSGNAKVLSKSMLMRSIDPAYSGRVMSASSFLGLVAGVAASLASGLLAAKLTPLGYLIAFSLVIGSAALTGLLQDAFGGSPAKEARIGGELIVEA